MVAGPLGNLWTASNLRAKDVNSQMKLAAIGVGGSRGVFSRGGEDGRSASRFARMIAVCDVDSVHTAEFNKSFGGKLAEYTDYRKLLEKEKPDVVTIGTPDHWHVPIAVAALHAGCDVYCEKPLTLTIDEGKLVRDAVKKTGRVFQVGTQQRSEFNLYFLQAIAIVKSGRLGKKVNAFLVCGGAPVKGGPFPDSDPPMGLDWDMWVGPAPEARYSLQRRHDFRWYFDYSGGKLTDWGAHHIDIAQWGLGKDDTGPVKVSAKGEFGPVVPEHFDWVSYMGGRAKLPNGFQTSPNFDINCEYEDGTKLHIYNSYDRGDGRTKIQNGIMFEGEDGRIFVDRDRLTGKPVEELSSTADKKKLHEQVVKL
jgi:predicted dehydrogenase